MNRRQFLAAAAVTTSLSAGCVGDSGGDRQQQQDGGGGQAATTIAMTNTTFQPSKAEVDAGATVEWVNEDSYAHDVTSAQFHDAAVSWDFAKALDGGESTAHTFEDAGVYEYYCTIHGKDTMCGAVLVGGATLDKSLPCGGGAYGDDGVAY